MKISKTIGLVALTASLVMGVSGAAHALKLVPNAGDNPTDPKVGALTSITYAKETLRKGSQYMTPATDNADKTMYYDIMRSHHLAAPPGVIGVAGDTYVLSYTLEGMVFADNVKAPKNFAVAAGATEGDKEAVFRSVSGVVGATAIQLSAMFAVSADGGSISMMARNQSLEKILGGGRGTRSHGPVTIKVQPALMETVMAEEPGPVAKAASEFMNFGGSEASPMLTTSLGTIQIGVVSPNLENARSKKGIEVAESDVGALLDITSVTALEGGPANPVTFSGDFSFVKTLALVGAAGCSTGLAELRKTSESDSEMLTGETMPQEAQMFELFTDKGTPANNRVLQSLCIEVDGETAIPKTEPYMVTAKYAGFDDDTAFAPKGMTRELAMIDRDGTTVHLPYLTTHEQYNHRITLRNRSAQPTRWSFTFAPETGVDAVPGDMATGELMAGEMKVLRTTDVVELTGGYRTAASVTLPLPPTAVDVSTTLVNKMGGTATVTVHLSDDGL